MIIRTRTPRSAKVNTVLEKTADGTMQIRREPIPEMPADLKQVIEEMK